MVTEPASRWNPSSGRRFAALQRKTGKPINSLAAEIDAERGDLGLAIRYSPARAALFPVTSDSRLAVALTTQPDPVPRPHGQMRHRHRQRPGCGAKTGTARPVRPASSPLDHRKPRAGADAWPGRERHIGVARRHAPGLGLPAVRIERVRLGPTAARAGAGATGSARPAPPAATSRPRNSSGRVVSRTIIGTGG